MYKTTFEKLKNTPDSLTIMLEITSAVSNFFCSIRYYSLLKRTEDPYNNPNPILLFNHTATPYGLVVLIAKKNLLYTSKI